MAYYSGTAASLTALRTALLTHAQADGWALTGDVLSKAGVYFQIQETATNITCLGCEDNAVSNPAPSVVNIGRIYQSTSYGNKEISFPCSYEVFGFDQELYLVVNYDTDSYQWMAFGKSTVPGLLKPGGWFAATLGILSSTIYTGPIATDALGAGAIDSGRTSGGPFWGYARYYSSARNNWINHGLDNLGWRYGSYDSTEGGLGAYSLAPLVSCQPSGWNGEAVLMPIRAFISRSSYKSSLIADLANARYLRIDNFTPGEVITLGADKWKVFPFYRKDAANRNAGSGVNHTGTFGWALRYQGL